MKRYFVSYSWVSDKQSGTGSVEMESERVTNYDVIKRWTHWINENVKDKYNEPVKCTVVSYKRLAWWSL